MKISSSAFDAGDAVLVQKVTTTKTESPDPTAVINAYQLLFPKDEDRVSGTVSLISTHRVFFSLLDGSLHTQ